MSDEYDEGLMEDLEKEFMTLAQAGDHRAFDFALEFSDNFNLQSQVVLMRLMGKVPPVRRVDFDTAVQIVATAMVGRERLVKVIIYLTQWPPRSMMCQVDAVHHDRA